MYCEVGIERTIEDVFVGPLHRFSSRKNLYLNLIAMFSAIFKIAENTVRAGISAH